MVRKKEENVKENEARELLDYDTFQELVDGTPLLKGFPVMVEPAQLTSGQQVQIGLASGVMDDHFQLLQKLEDSKPDDYNYRLAQAEAELILTLRGVLNELLIGADKIEDMEEERKPVSEWLKGRSMNVMYVALTTVLAWYRGQLGKYEASVVSSQPGR